MMTTLKRVLVVTMLAAFVGLSSGCLALAAAGAAGAGVAYAKGKTEGVVEAEPTRVVEAARAVFAEQGIAETGYKVQDDGELQLTGRTRGDDKVTVTVAPRGTQRSKLWVRVGVMGDEQRNNRIYYAILNRVE